MDRYEWRKPSDLPERLEFVDAITKHPIGAICDLGRKWHWYRKTSVLLHGAPPAEGFTTSLADAKTAMLKDLPP